VAGGVALNTLVKAARVSRDIDVFHDTEEAVLNAWVSDKKVLEQQGYLLESLRELPSFVEALIRRDDKTVLMQWARDSAFRFFPLIEDEIFGLTMHPFDLATNKVLAMAGRLEVRDWIDVISCHDRIQNIGYLFWSACGKDPGFNPASLLAEARRGSRYSAAEVRQLSFEGAPPDAHELGKRWHDIVQEAEQIIGLLPADHVGTCVLDKNGELFRGDPEILTNALRRNEISYHNGTLRGALPMIVSRGVGS
jgi:hypothetical protein